MKVDSEAVTREAPSTFTTSITTGQGWIYNDLWTPENSYPSSRIGNSRAPIPKCCINQSCGVAVGTISFSAEANFPDVASAEFADIYKTKFDEIINGSGAASLESTQGQVIWQPDLEEESFHTSESELSGEDVDRNEFCEPPAAETKPSYKRKTRKREKKKVGRPIVYKGDPNAPELSELERRRIKRRIANRESARRVRHKRQEVMEDLQAKMEVLQEKNSQLSERAQLADNNKSQLTFELADLAGKLASTKSDNQKMHQEIGALRKSLQVKMSALEEELDKCATEVDTKSGMVLLTGNEPEEIFPDENFQLDAKPSSEMRAAIDWLPSLKLEDTFGMLPETLPETSR